MEPASARDRTPGGDTRAADAPDPEHVAAVATEVRTSLQSLADDLVSASHPDVDVEVAVRPIDASLVGELFDSERSLVERAVPRRRAEFATGRALLRSLLTVDGAIGRIDTGAAALPPGATASLAHDIEIAVAVRASGRSVAGIGVDVEPLQELESAMVRMIRRPDDELDDPMAVFVAKEAVYKSWSEPGRRILDFHDVHLRRTGDPGAGPPGGLLAAHVAEDDTVIEVAVTTSGGRWIALALRTSAPRPPT